MPSGNIMHRKILNIFHTRETCRVFKSRTCIFCTFWVQIKRINLHNYQPPKLNGLRILKNTKLPGGYTRLKRYEAVRIIFPFPCSKIMLETIHQSTTDCPHDIPIVAPQEPPAHSSSPPRPDKKWHKRCETRRAPGRNKPLGKLIACH